MQYIHLTQLADNPAFLIKNQYRSMSIFCVIKVLLRFFKSQHSIKKGRTLRNRCIFG